MDELGGGDEVDMVEQESGDLNTRIATLLGSAPVMATLPLGAK